MVEKHHIHKHKTAKASKIKTPKLSKIEWTKKQKMTKATKPLKLHTITLTQANVVQTSLAHLNDQTEEDQWKSLFGSDVQVDTSRVVPTIPAPGNVSTPMDSVLLVDTNESTATGRYLPNFQTSQPSSAFATKGSNGQPRTKSAKATARGTTSVLATSSHMTNRDLAAASQTAQTTGSGSPSSTANPNALSTGMSAGALAGVIIAIVALVSVCVGIIPFVLRRRRQKQKAVEKKDFVILMEDDPAGQSGKQASRFPSLSNMKDFDPQSAGTTLGEGPKTQIRPRSENSDSTRGQRNASPAVGGHAWKGERAADELNHILPPKSGNNFVDPLALPKRVSSLGMEPLQLNDDVQLPDPPPRLVPLNIAKAQVKFPFEIAQPSPLMGHSFPLKSASTTHLPEIPAIDETDVRDSQSPPATASSSPKRNNRLRSQTLSAVEGKRPSTTEREQSAPHSRDSSYGGQLSLFPSMKSPQASELSSAPLSFPLISSPPTSALPPVPDLNGLNVQDFFVKRQASTASIRSENGDIGHTSRERRQLDQEYVVLHKRLSTPVRHFSVPVGPHLVKHRSLSSVESTSSSIFEAKPFELEQEKELEERNPFSEKPLTLDFDKPSTLMSSSKPAGTGTENRKARPSSRGIRTSLVTKVASARAEDAFNFFSSPIDGNGGEASFDDAILKPLDISQRPDSDSAEEYREVVNETPNLDRVRSSVYSQATHAHNSRMDALEMGAVNDIMLRPRPKTLTVRGSLPGHKLSRDITGYRFSESLTSEPDNNASHRSSQAGQILVREDENDIDDDKGKRKKNRGGAFFASAKLDEDVAIESRILESRSGNIISARARSLCVRHSRPKDKEISEESPVVVTVQEQQRMETIHNENENENHKPFPQPSGERKSDFYNAEDSYSPTLSVLNFYSRYSAGMGGPGSSTPSLILKRFSDVPLPEVPVTGFIPRPLSSPSNPTASPLNFPTTQPYLPSPEICSISTSTVTQSTSHDNQENRTAIANTEVKAEGLPAMPGTPLLRSRRFERSPSLGSRSTTSRHSSHSGPSLHEGQDDSFSSLHTTPPRRSSMLSKIGDLNLNFQTLGQPSSFEAGDSLECGTYKNRI